jgi:hypothetical protein
MSDSQTTDPSPDPKAPAYSVVDNPYFGGVMAFGVIALVAGAIALIIGIVNSSNPGGDSGVGELALAGPLISVGGLFMVAALVIGGVDWALVHRRRD